MAHFSVGKLVKDYCESLTVTQGDGFGEPFTLMPWEKNFITKGIQTNGHNGGAIDGEG